MTAASQAVLVLIEGWEVAARSSTGTIYRRPDRVAGVVRFAYIGSRGAVQLRAGDGVSPVRIIRASEQPATARQLALEALDR